MSPIAAAFASSNSFLPHGYCIAWEPSLVWLHVVADSVIAVSYYSIPLALVYFLYRRPQTGYNWVIGLFAGFILACGTTHLLGIYVLWEPAYWMEGMTKAATAGISLITAVLLWPLVPRVLALPTPTELQLANDHLHGEVEERSRVEAELRALQAELEDRVRKRTADLETAKLDLQREAAERRRIDAFKDELVSMVSHELRTPLTSIAGSLAMIQQPEQYTAEESQELAAIALRNTDRMMRLLNSLTDIDRIESREIPMNSSPVALGPLLRMAVKDHEGYARRHGVRLELHDGALEGFVRGDADRLMQVLSNLISNAVKHAPTDTAVGLTCALDGGRARISVMDSGPGIAPEDQARVFEKFVRLKVAGKHHSDGVGLGLSIARAIVLRHGGRIGTESREGGPTTFYFEVPLMEMAAVTAADQPGRSNEA